MRQSIVSLAILLIVFDAQCTQSKLIGCRSCSASDRLLQLRQWNVDSSGQLPESTTAYVTADSATVGTSSISSSIFNLAKCILGAGILSLPSGVARFSYDTSGLLPSSALLAIMGLMSAYSFQSIGRTCSIHGVKTISEAWGKAVHEGSKKLILALILFKTCLACLCYSIIIGNNRC